MKPSLSNTPALSVRGRHAHRRNRSRIRLRSASVVVLGATIALATAASGGSAYANSRSSSLKTTHVTKLTKLIFGTPGAVPDTTSELTGAAGWALQQGKGQAILKRFGYSYGGDVGFESGVPAEDALVGGSIQVAVIGGTPALEGLDQGHATRAIFANGAPTDLGIAAPSGGVTNVKQLAGKTVGVGVGTIMDQYLGYVLAKAGLTGKVTIDNLPNVADAYPALLNHSIDAYVDSASLVDEWAAKGGVKLIQSSAVSFPKYTSSDVAVVTDSFLNAHPNIEQAFWAVYSEGQSLIKAHPKPYLEWAAKEALVPYSIEKATTNLPASFQSTPIPAAGVTATAQAQSFLLSQKLITKTTPLNKWFVAAPSKGTGS